MLPDTLAGVLTLMPLLLLFLPWVLARVRMRRLMCNPPEPKLGFWSALAGSIVVFFALAIFGTLVVWSSAGALSVYCPPGMKEDRYQGFLVLVVNIPVSLLTGIIHRTMRWERLEAPKKGVAKNTSPVNR